MNRKDLHGSVSTTGSSPEAGDVPTATLGNPHYHGTWMDISASRNWFVLMMHDKPILVKLPLAFSPEEKNLPHRQTDGAEFFGLANVGEFAIRSE